MLVSQTHLLLKFIQNWLASPPFWLLGRALATLAVCFLSQQSGRIVERELFHQAATTTDRAHFPWVGLSQLHQTHF